MSGAIQLESSVSGCVGDLDERRSKKMSRRSWCWRCALKAVSREGPPWHRGLCEQGHGGLGLTEPVVHGTHTVSPLHTNESCSESMFVSPICS